MEKKQQFSIFYFVAAFLLIATLQQYLGVQHADNLPYSDFKALLRAGKIAEVNLADSIISGTLSTESIESLVSTKTAERLAKLDKGPHPFSVVRVNDPGLVADLDAAKVRYAGQIQSTWLPTCCPGSCLHSFSSPSGASS